MKQIKYEDFFPHYNTIKQINQKKKKNLTWNLRCDPFDQSITFQESLQTGCVLAFDICQFLPGTDEVITQRTQSVLFEGVISLYV